MRIGVRKNDSLLLHWPDTIGFDHRGMLSFTLYLFTYVLIFRISLRQARYWW